MRGGFEDARTLQHFLSQEDWAPVEVGDLPQALASVPLDLGERESLALALRQEATLLIDEGRGRQVAFQLGVPVRGTCGILIQAYRSGLITADQLRLYFGQIEERTDIWISPALVRRLLREVLD
jgi:predicted nucleic acid-binding protein